MEYRSQTQRLWIHVGFWFVFTVAYAISSTTFAPPTDMAFPLPIRFLRFWGYEVGMLPLKLLVTYGFLYYLYPRYLVHGKFGKAALLSIMLIIPLLFLYRWQMYYAMFPLFYGEYPNYNPIEARRLFFSLFDFATALALPATLKFVRHHLLSKQREQALINEKLKSELNYLRAQTNPHFLFNTLNNIYALARRNAPNTPEVIMRLSKILRFMLYECDSPLISLETELKVISDYIELEKLRYSDRLKIYFKVEVDNDTQTIAPLLLLPLVENAFKHGVSESRFKSHVKIDIALRRGLLILKVENTFDPDEEVNSQGIGISNVRRQLELIYPECHELKLQREADIFRVYLEINLSQRITAS